MRCKSCGPENLGRLAGEIVIHFSGLKNIKEPHVWVFPELVVCSSSPVRLLAKDRAVGAE